MAMSEFQKRFFSEVTQEGKPQSEILHNYLQDKFVDTDLSEQILDFGELGRGEPEAIALFKKLCADFLLLDDKKARKIADLNKIPIIGSLGVLLSAKKQGLIRSVRSLIDILEISGIHISKPLIQKILLLAREE